MQYKICKALKVLTQSPYHREKQKNKQILILILTLVVHILYQLLCNYYRSLCISVHKHMVCSTISIFFGVSKCTCIKLKKSVKKILIVVLRLVYVGEQAVANQP